MVVSLKFYDANGKDAGSSHFDEKGNVIQNSRLQKKADKTQSVKTDQSK